MSLSKKVLLSQYVIFDHYFGYFVRPNGSRTSNPFEAKRFEQKITAKRWAEKNDFATGIYQILLINTVHEFGKKEN